MAAGPPLLAVGAGAPLDGEVRLHVYDLSDGAAKRYSSALLNRKLDGIWHTGVVVFGLEFFFGGGIQCLRPRQIPRIYGIRPSQRISLGMSQASRAELQQHLIRIEPEWTLARYDLLTRNCNNFADELCKFLVGRGVPAHITSLPDDALNNSILGKMLLRPAIEGLGAQMRLRITQCFGEERWDDDDDDHDDVDENANDEEDNEEDHQSRRAAGRIGRQGKKEEHASNEDTKGKDAAAKEGRDQADGQYDEEDGETGGERDEEEDGEGKQGLGKPSEGKTSEGNQPESKPPSENQPAEEQGHQERRAPRLPSPLTRSLLISPEISRDSYVVFGEAVFQTLFFVRGARRGRCRLRSSGTGSGGSGSGGSGSGGGSGSVGSGSEGGSGGGGSGGSASASGSGGCGGCRRWLERHAPSLAQ